MLKYVGFISCQNCIEQHQPKRVTFESGQQNMTILRQQSNRDLVEGGEHMLRLVITKQHEQHKTHFGYNPTQTNATKHIISMVTDIIQVRLISQQILTSFYSHSILL